jgi:hypothetical protein
MPKKALNNRLIGRISQKVANLCILNDKTPEDCFDMYMKNLTIAMKMYDIPAKKDVIISKVEEKLLDAEISVSDKAPKSSVKKKLRYADPLMLKVRGEVELDPTPEGLIIRRTAKTRKIKMKCPEGTKGVLIADEQTGEKDKAGCEIL